jgi:hypothetical protein
VTNFSNAHHAHRVAAEGTAATVTAVGTPPAGTAEGAAAATPAAGCGPTAILESTDQGLRGPRVTPGGMAAGPAGAAVPPAVLEAPAGAPSPGRLGITTPSAMTSGMTGPLARPGRVDAAGRAGLGATTPAAPASPIGDWATCPSPEPRGACGERAPRGAGDDAAALETD